jgi:addiction module HigA family antidote
MSDERLRIGMTPPHPGSFIRTEILDELGLSVSRAADILGVRRATLSDLVNGKASLSPEMALRIEKAFGVSMDTLLRMGAWYDSHAMRRRADQINVKPLHTYWHSGSTTTDSTERNTVPPPEGWGDDELTKFLDSVRENQFATFTNKIPESKAIIKIDEFFGRVIIEGTNRGYMYPDFLLLARAHSAYRVAAGCAFSGQAAEVHSMFRLMLEQAGYAILISRNSELLKVWLNRDADPARVRKEFTAGKIKEALTASDTKLRDVFHGLYESTIQFGAHPNEMSVTGSIRIERQDNQEFVKVIYLHQDGVSLNHSLQCVRTVGLCVLSIFKQIFGELFDESGVSSAVSEWLKDP